MMFDEWLGTPTCCSEQGCYEIGPQSQQAKIEAITKQRDSFIKAHHIAMNDVCEHKAKIDKLQARIDTVVYILTYTNHASTPLCNELRDILKGNKDGRV